MRITFTFTIHMTLLGFVFYAAIGLTRRLLIPWHASAGTQG